MGHRNIIGWKKDGEVTGTYSQWGGYRDGIPVRVQNELREFSENKRTDQVWAELTRLVEGVRLVNANDVVPVADRKKYADSHQDVSTGTDWYSYLRRHQGSLMAHLTAGIMTDDSDFIQNSLFCEYAVVVDLDDQKIVLLDGFNQDPTKEWPPIAIDVSTWKPSYKGEKLEYFACSVDWEGTLEEFLALDIKSLEPEDA